MNYIKSTLEILTLSIATFLLAKLYLMNFEFIGFSGGYDDTGKFLFPILWLFIISIYSLFKLYKKQDKAKFHQIAPLLLLLIVLFFIPLMVLFLLSSQISS